jgi:putative RNA 2'-phosphotransferase
MDDKTISKSLSYWLRHQPDAGGIAIDPAGWAEVDAVLGALERAKLPHAAEDLQRVVAASDKNRFELSPDGLLIRARQGHSIPIDLGWPVTVPPEHLFHGTVEKFLPAILSEGLRPMARHHVHLSPDEGTATQVGARRGKPVILRIAAGALHAEGAEFRLSSNGVWLVDHVPPAFIARAD